MRLVASAIVRNESGRYLEPWLGHLREFCDALVLLDDASTDETATLAKAWGAIVFRSSEPRFDEHEGRTRQQLLEFTLAQEPTHVLAIDADEFVADGHELRHQIVRDHRSERWSLSMQEVWELDGDCLCLRHDGYWRPYPAVMVWRVPEDTSRLRIADKALACGRIPGPLGLAKRLNQGVLHFGWANEGARRARYDRYMRIDGGRFHDRRHLESIVASDVELRGVPWPTALEPHRAAITSTAKSAADV